MRAAADDVSRTFSTRQLTFTVFLLVMIFHTTSSVPQNTTNLDADNSFIVYHLRVIFLCDKTSSESFCAVNQTNEEVSNIFSDIGDNTAFLRDCQSNISCSNLYNISSDYNHSKLLIQMDNNYMILRKLLSNTAVLRINVTYHVLGGNMRSKLDDAHALVISESADMLVAIGDYGTVQTVAIVADGNNIPSLGYITEHGKGLKVSACYM